MIRGFKKEWIRPIAIFIAVLCFLWFAIYGEQGLYRLHKSFKLKGELKEKITTLKSKIKDMEEEKKLLDNPNHLELIIRQELGYVKPGETVFQQMSP